MRGELVIRRRFNGPAGSANGGYACGLVAGHVGGDGPVEVTLRLPPPLERPLAVERAGEGVRVLDGDAVVAEARPVALGLDVPPPVGVEAARAASARYPGFERHAFPTCFVCGPERAPGDGLRVFAGPVDGGPLVAATWTPAEARPELVWAAIDCPGAFAVGFAERGETVLGRMTARVERLPEPGAEHVVVAWPRGEDGRKLHAGTALFRNGVLLAYAAQTWIAPR